jgi:CcmD family protein
MIVRTVALLLTLPLVVASRAALAADDYVPYNAGAGAEQVSAPLFVVIAYSVIWIALVGFVVSVWRRQRQLERELEILRQQLEGGGGR